MPLGGPIVSYKGTALAVLVEVMATVLAGDRATDRSRIGNSLCLVGISLHSGARAAASELVAHLESAKAASGTGVVLGPGEREQRHVAPAREVSLPDATWRAIKEVAAHYGVERQLAALVARSS